MNCWWRRSRGRPEGWRELTTITLVAGRCTLRYLPPAALYDGKQYLLERFLCRMWW